MFTSFVVFGMLPLAAYAPCFHYGWLSNQRRFVVACVLGIVSLIFLGLIKGYVTVAQASCGMSAASKRRAVVASATKMVLTGSIASVISFIVSLELHSG
jgi:VIT1/CCC1 family predicted Fe2+/Mn2+ transporter